MKISAKRLLERERLRLAAALPARIWDRVLLAPALELLRRPGKRFRAALVGASWRLAGGQGSVPAELPLAVEILHAGALIVDDIEDGAERRRGEPALHHVVGVPVAFNTGNWMYFLPFELIERAGLDPRTTAEMTRALYRTQLLCHEGQALDLGVRVTDLAQSELPAVVAAATERKTSALLELAAALGAMAAGAEPPVVQALVSFGRDLGLALQMLDDLGALEQPARADKAAEDLGHARPTWPWAWAAIDTERPEFESLTRWLEEVASGAPAAPLARALADRIGVSGRSRARARLDLALSALGGALPASADLDDLATEIGRLAVAYG